MSYNFTRMNFPKYFCFSKQWSKAAKTGLCLGFPRNLSATWRGLSSFFFNDTFHAECSDYCNTFGQFFIFPIFYVCCEREIHQFLCLQLPLFTDMIWIFFSCLLLYLFSKLPGIWIPTELLFVQDFLPDGRSSKLKGVKKHRDLRFLIWTFSLKVRVRSVWFCCCC